jgi:hypothetical protein
MDNRDIGLLFPAGQIFFCFPQSPGRPELPRPLFSGSTTGSFSLGEELTTHLNPSPKIKNAFGCNFNLPKRFDGIVLKILKPTGYAMH